MTDQDKTALLSKLRAEGVQAGEPVADERAAFEEAMQRHGQSIDRWPNPHGGYRKSITDIAWYVWLERAALANPPAYAKASDAELDKLYRETITEGPENDIRCWENPHRLYARAVLASAPASEDGLTAKQAWWAGYRAGKGLPPDTPRQDAVKVDISSARLVTHWPNGTPRDERDTASDPEGKLIHDPTEPLLAASAPVADPYPARLMHERDNSLAERVDSWHQRNPSARVVDGKPHSLFHSYIQQAHGTPPPTSAPVAGEPRGRQGVSVERLAKDPFLAAQLWRNPVDRAPVAGEARECIEQMAVNRYRPVPDGKFSYKVVAGDGTRSLYTGTKDSCLRVAAKLTEAFLDGAFVASDAAPQASKPDFADAYEGAREDLAIWKRRALEAENLLRVERKTARRLIAELNAANGPTHMGEPATQADKDGGDCAKGAGAVAMRDAAFEAVRKRLCAIPRYSFYLDDDGVVRRVEGRSGNWIEFDAAHELFDPVAVDAALSPTPSAVKQSLTATQTGEKGEKDE